MGYWKCTAERDTLDHGSWWDSVNGLNEEGDAICRRVPDLGPVLGSHNEWVTH